MLFVVFVSLFIYFVHTNMITSVFIHSLPQDPSAVFCARETPPHCTLSSAAAAGFQCHYVSLPGVWDVYVMCTGGAPLY